MKIEVVPSIRGVPIRLTSERWMHIVENHDDLAGRFYDVLETIADPDLVLRGHAGERLAVRTSHPLALVVVYREMRRDGFIITAFQTSKLLQVQRNRKVLWRRKSSKRR